MTSAPAPAVTEDAPPSPRDMARPLPFLQAPEHDCLLLAFGAELNYRRSVATYRLFDDHGRAGTGATYGFAGH